MTPTKVDVLSSAEIINKTLEEKAKREKQEIMKEIERLENELRSVKGTKCLRYSRIVGYFSEINQWNPGKFAEWQERKTFEIGNKSK